MKRKLISTTSFLFLIFSLLSIKSCERDGTSSCFPNDIINTEIFLNGYTNLMTATWEYTKGEVGTGSRGLIIFQKASGEYKIYNRNAPHLCPGEDTTLTVITDDDGFLKIYCPKDGAKWLLQNGEPQNFQATGIPKNDYSYSISSSNVMSIYQ